MGMDHATVVVVIRRQMLSVLGGLRWQPPYAKSIRYQLPATTPFYSFLRPNTNTLKYLPQRFNSRTCFNTYCKKIEEEQVTNNNTPFSHGFSALKEEFIPLESENLWTTLSLYLFILHIPFSFGGLSVVALLTGESFLDPQTKALSLLIIQILELSGALVLFKYNAKPQYEFTNFFTNNKLLNGRNWIVASVLGFGFLVFLIFLTSLLAETLFGSKPVNPILKEILLYSDISRVSCVLVLCIVTPLLEEVVYRGFLLTSLSSTMEWQQAVAISSIIFSAIHFSGENFLQLFIVGCVLGCSYCWTGNLNSNIAIHSLYNALTLIITYYS
ncbi:putative CAAX amino terminal protease [Lupinus albus]|uniref:Putative CAAX amino terminal protease n=1 Tax=Lupinus albus TaxID=3870 RepID=A0A6A4NH49_LUPAL|nr:putative CAAX amino terminal protease [Lupinus albus]